MKEPTKKMLNYFLIGIFAVVPIVIVLQIMIFFKDRLLDILIFVHGYAISYVYTVLFFVVSFFILVWIGREIVRKGRPFIITAFEHVIDRIPVLNTVYRVLKKVIMMFSNHDQTIAKEVVYVEYPKEGLWVPAYVTNRHENMLVLFVPTSPNPTSGFTVIVDKARVVESRMGIEEATSFIVSVGVDYALTKEMTLLSNKQPQR